MTTYHRDYNLANGNIVTNTVFAIVFCVITFCYVYFYQSDVLMSTQHLLSEGVTHYHPLIGAMIITLVLYLLQVGISFFLKRHMAISALAYFPSFLLLGAMTSYDMELTNLNPYHGYWLWVLPLALVLWGVVIYAVKELYISFQLHKQTVGMFRLIWTNLLLMVMMFMAAVGMGIDNDIFHYRLRMERLMFEGDYEKAALVGWESQATDKTLTMLRAYSLSHEGMLGDRMFTFPLEGYRKAIFPTDSLSFVFFPKDSVYRHLGAIPVGKVYDNADVYIKVMEKSNLGTKALGDYLLTGALLERNLKGFAELLPRYYEQTYSTPLPMHYREALVVANEKGLYDYNDSVVEERYRLFDNVHNSSYRDLFYKRKANKEFSNTYWNYYWN